MNGKHDLQGDWQNVAEYHNVKSCVPWCVCVGGGVSVPVLVWMCLCVFVCVLVCLCVGGGL